MASGLCPCLSRSHGLAAAKGISLLALTWWARCDLFLALTIWEPLTSMALTFFSAPDLVEALTSF